MSTRQASNSVARRAKCYGGHSVGRVTENMGGVTTAVSREKKKTTNLLDVVRRHRGAPELHGLVAGPEHARQDRRQKRIRAHLELPEDQTRLHTRLRCISSDRKQPPHETWDMLAIGCAGGFAERCVGLTIRRARETEEAERGSVLLSSSAIAQNTKVLPP